MRRKIVLADKIGFCFGVRRAIDIAEAALKKTRPIYSLGAIIHNRNVVGALSKKGLKVVKDINKVKRGTIIVSSHGISPHIAKRILKKGIALIDTTCPFVLNAQKIAKRLGDEGYKVVIVGDAEHPEVKALVDFASKRAIVVKDRKEAKETVLKPDEKIGVISQTTQSISNFLAVIEALSEGRTGQTKVFNTICKDAARRQAAALELAGKVDAMLVVGGRNSANTKRLFDVCRRVCGSSRLVETEGEVRNGWFKPVKVIGVTSGASTPLRLVKKVVAKIKSIR